MERRANGEGTKIKKHAKGGYYRAITLPDGKRKFIYGATKKKVVEKEEEVRKEFDEGVTKGPIVMKEYLRSWLNDSVRGTVRISSYQRYEDIVRLHLIPEIGHVKIKDLNPLQVQKIYSKKMRSGLSARTVQYIHRTLSKSLKQAVKWGYVGRNVCESVEPPKPIKKEIQPLAYEQVETFLSVTEGFWWQAFYLTGVTTGMRSGELLGLKWKDLDLDNGVVRVRRSLSLTKEGFVFNPPKSAKSKRNIELIPQTVEAMIAHRQTETYTEGEDLVFGTDGEPTPWWIPQDHFKRVCRSLGFPKGTTLHTLRHTFATLLLIEGVHPKIVSEALGHSSITLTLDTYSHYVPSLQGVTSAAMRRVFSDHNTSTTNLVQEDSPENGNTPVITGSGAPTDTF